MINWDIFVEDLQTPFVKLYYVTKVYTCSFRIGIRNRNWLYIQNEMRNFCRLHYKQHYCKVGFQIGTVVSEEKIFLYIDESETNLPLAPCFFCPIKIKWGIAPDLPPKHHSCKIWCFRTEEWNMIKLIQKDDGQMMAIAGMSNLS